MNSDGISVSDRSAGFRAPARYPKTAELVADDIRRRIIRGELREGDYLPLEGELKSTLGISRPTLREANRHGTKTRDQRRSNNNPGRRFHLTPHNNAEC